MVSIFDWVLMSLKYVSYILSSRITYRLLSSALRICKIKRFTLRVRGMETPYIKVIQVDTLCTKFEIKFCKS